LAVFAYVPQIYRAVFQSFAKIALAVHYSKANRRLAHHTCLEKPTTAEATYAWL
jgi:hypothetical protein